MRRALIVIALILAGCGGGGTDDSQTVLEYCVEQVDALFEKHDLPRSNDTEAADVCAEWMSTREDATKAHLLIQVREADKELREGR